MRKERGGNSVKIQSELCEAELANVCPACVIEQNFRRCSLSFEYPGTRDSTVEILENGVKIWRNAKFCNIENSKVPKFTGSKWKYRRCWNNFVTIHVARFVFDEWYIKFSSGLGDALKYSRITATKYWNSVNSFRNTWSVRKVSSGQRLSS